MNFKILTFGCKLNQAESEQISADLICQGYLLGKHPDLIVINACAVTHKAVRKGRQKVAQLKRKFPRAKVVVTGCVIEKDWAGVDSWLKKQELIKNNNIKNKTSRTRTLIKIQEGCNNYCAYCIVPFLRGKPKSMAAGRIIQLIKEKQAQGFKEIVLTGINIGLYGNGLDNLLKKILAQTSIERIRLGSLWPTHISDKLINLYSGNHRLCPHFHLSIQSGSDKILKSMNRSYTVAKIQQITQKCRVKIPNINFTCDIIVGFPGETDNDFQASKDLIKSIGFSKVHVFKYSKRPRTKAARMPLQIPEKIKQDRSRELIKIELKSPSKKLSILWEGKKNGYWYGFTANYIKTKRKVKPGERSEEHTSELQSH